MVLESMISFKEAVKRPRYMFFISGIVAVLCVMISKFVFNEYVGLFTTFLITMTLIPITRVISIKETEKSIEGIREGFFQRYREVIIAYGAIFSGIVFFLSLLYVLLPDGTANMIFYEQVREISRIRGNFVFGGLFTTIFLNNAIVLTLSFLFSLLFGFGAIFIVSWNATVLAAAIGMLSKALGGAKTLPLAILTFLPHGSLEILAYLIGGLAGGILSVAITKRNISGVKFYRVLSDTFMLYVYSVLLLVVAGLIESIAIILS
ncbi:MAG: stage II sporulation protein M [Candidatus Aenigmarchaeota archaeon]|nr:stage II sporulation protein M [Candidatus Aenigmarchaeota archaeon]